MKKYREYKNTGLFWLPQIPKKWEWRFLSQIAKEQNDKKPDNMDFIIMSLSYGNIIRKRNLYSGLVPDNYNSYQVIHDGNIILRLTDLQNDHTSLRTGLVKETGIITSAYTCIFPLDNATYLNYLLHVYDIRKVFYGMGGGVRQSIGYKDIRKMRVPVPPREEQDQIVRYLDWKVSEINQLIAIRKKQVQLLKKKKYAYVSDLITHGLNYQGAKKYSGVNWLGEIPSHWNIVKLRNILTPVSIKNCSDMQLLSVVRERGVIIRDVENQEENHNVIPEDLSNYKRVLKNQFVINKMKAWQGSYGISNFDGIVSPAYFVFDIQFKNLEYFHYAIRSKVYVNFFAQASDGIRVGQWDLSMDKMKEIPFLLPSEDEQEKIVLSIKKHTTLIENLIKKINAEIELLLEFKNRLISDVVTGQIDVREIYVPEFEVIEEDISDTEINSEEEDEES